MHANPPQLDSPAVISQPESLLARKLLNREVLSVADLAAAGIKSSKATGIMQSLSNVLRLGDPEKISSFYFVFESASEVARFVRDVVSYDANEAKNSFKKLVDQELLKRLCLGEVSSARVGQLFGHPSLPSVMLFDLLRENGWLLDICPSTWKQAVHSVMRAKDRLDILDQFMHSFRLPALGNPRPSGFSRLLNMMFVWTQGNASAVRAVSNMSGTDAFEILEAVLRADGISEFPAFEFHSISSFLKSYLSADELLEPRLRLFLVILARSVEKTSEMIHSASKSDDSRTPNVVVIDLDQGNVRSILDTFNPGHDLENSQITILGDFSLSLSTIVETKVEIVLSPALWFVHVSELDGATITVTISSSRPKQTAAVSFSSWKINPQTVILADDQPTSTVQFRIVSGSYEFLIVRDSIETTCVSLRVNDEHALTVSWSDDKAKFSTSGLLPTRPAQSVPTSLLPTVPMLPSQLTDPPRNICVLGLDTSQYSQLVSPWDTVVCLTVPQDSSEWRIRDMVQQCAQTDLLLISANLMNFSDPTTAFLVGLLVGSCHNVNVIGEVSLPFVSQLLDQGIIQ
jgi:hypothetical protein